MSRNSVLCAVGLVALALLALWRGPDGRVEPARSAPATVPPAGSTDGGSAPVDLVPPRSGEASGVAAPFEEPVLEEPRAPARRDPATRADRAVAGRVVLPGGFVPREEVRIMLRRGTDWIPSGAAMAADGSFALSVPEDQQQVALALASRFLWMPAPVMARPGDRGVEMRPMAFAVIEGVVAPPAPLSTLGAERESVRLEWAIERNAPLSIEARQGPRPDAVSPDEGGAFELRWVTTGARILLHAENPFGPDWLEELAPLAPGEVRRVEIALGPGIRVAGRVIDENGEPVIGVRLALGAEGQVGSSWNRWSEPDPTSDPEGRFALARVAPDVTLVRTDDRNLLRQGEAEVRGEKGDVLDLELRVVRGGSIEGTVRWPDGTHPDRFEAEITEPIRKSAEGRAGRFLLSGLPEGRHRLEVRAARAGLTGRAEVRGAETGGPPLSLVLEEAPACELSGLVEQGDGAPVGRFSVRAYDAADAARSASADGRGGRFRLSGLTPGRWHVRVHADGFQEVEQLVELTPGVTPELRFVLPSASRVRGRVVDARNAPVAGAWVGEEEAAFAARFFGTQDQGTDSEGRFDVEVDSTHLRLVAIANGHGPSEVLALDVAPGETVEGVELRLREACRVEGSVLDERGLPLAGAQVTPLGSDLQRIWAETDADGAFALDGLPPGDLRLTAWHAGKPGALATARLTVAPGRAATAELRFQAADPVRVRGRVTRAGEPFACELWLASESFFASCSTRADGTFEVVLQQPGEWRGALWGASEGAPALQPASVRRFTVSVPDAEEHTFELEFDALQGVTSLDEIWR